MEAAAAALEALDSDAEDDQVAQLQATLAKETQKHSKATKGQGTAKGIGWEESGRRSGTWCALNHYSCCLLYPPDIIDPHRV